MILPMRVFLTWAILFIVLTILAHDKSEKHWTTYVGVFMCLIALPAILIWWVWS